jgi:hypothetical protein
MVYGSSFFLFEPKQVWLVKDGQTIFMKRIFLFIFLSCNTLTAYSQTKLISHKSHSGSSANFKKALKENLFTIGESNFGMAPQRHVRNSKLDTVKLLSSNVAIMITSESCRWEDYDGRDRSNESVWSAGSDTVYDHPVFNAKNSLPEIKSKLKHEYFFANSIDSVVFIGFDGKYATVAPKQAHTPIVKKEKPIQEDEFIPRKRPSIFVIILLSLFTTLFRSPF